MINLKKIFALILCFCMFTGTVAFAQKKEYELWTQSPTITCGLTSSEVTIFKALENNTLELLPLTRIGPEYYLAICGEEITTGGYNGNSDTTLYTFYTLRTTESGLIVLSSVSASNEYYWDYGYSIADISVMVTPSYYKNKGYEVPYYLLNPKGKYVNLNWEEYDEYFFITSSGKLYHMHESAEYGEEGYPFINGGVLYRGQDRYKKNSSTYPYYTLEDGSTKASNTTPIYFKNGTMSYGTATKVAISQMTSGKGYHMYKEGFASTVSFPTYYQIPDSDNLFFRMYSEGATDPTDKKVYFSLTLTIYKSISGAMTTVNTVKIPTKSTSSTFTPQNIVGIDESYYQSKGLPIPAVSFGHYAVLGRDGTVCGLGLDTSKYLNHVYPCTYNGRYGVIRSCNGTNYIYKADPADNTNYYWQVINEIEFDTSGDLTIGEDIELKIKSSAHEGQNGYFSSYSSFNKPTATAMSKATIKEWWGMGLSNIFPDGRYVTATWTSMGSGLYEIWYNIYNTDGTLKASGPTGYSTYFSSSSSKFDLIAWAVNDSKFIVAPANLNNTFYKEYYRVAVVEETDTGEIFSKVDLGEKNITPPEASDTEVIQSKINFASSDLPLGYNIKDNVIDSGKLDVMLRNQVNSIRLNDIVIIAKEGYISGEQNTGVTLSSYSNYDYSFGDSYIRLYTNGQYFRWYCYYPEDLYAGTYDMTLQIGDKAIYVTIKIIEPPTNEGKTTVVF